MLGSDLSDRIKGKKGDDIIVGNGGDDSIDGGKGFDTAVYNGSIFDYFWSRQGKKITVTDLNTANGDDGTDTLKSIEALQFDDFLLYLDGTNNGPLALDDAFSGDEGTIISGNVLNDNGAGADIDFDGDVLSVVAGVLTTANGGTVTMLADGSFTYEPASGYSGTDSFEYTLSDGSAVDTGTVTLTVNQVSHPFFDDDEVVTINEDTPAIGNVIDTTSVDGPITVTSFTVLGDLTVYAAGDTAIIAGVGTLEILGDGSYTFTPDQHYNGAVPLVTYTMTDGSAPDDTSTLLINVTATNDDFTDADETVATDEDTPISGNVIDGVSPDGPITLVSFMVAGDLTVYAAGDTANIAGVGTLEMLSGGGYTFTPVQDYNGPVPTVTYTLTDGTGLDDTSTLSIDVTATNDDFTDNDEALSVDEDTQLLGNVIDAISPDGPVTLVSFTVRVT